MAGLAFLTALVVAVLVGRLVIELGHRLGLVDRPHGDLKVHSGNPVPLGGAAVLLGVIAGLAAGGVLPVALVASALLVWVLGLVDDIAGLNPWTRLLGSAVAGIVLVILVDGGLEATASVFWVTAVVVVVNAINLLDGLDALAGSVATVATLGITWFGFVQGVSNPWVVLTVTGALLGFLFWNRPPARLFLGDNGSYLVGLLLVWAAMWSSPDRMAGVVAVALIGVPLIDLGVTVFRRGLAGAPLFSGDRDHTYDRLHRQGLGMGRIALVFTGVQTVWMVAIMLVALSSGDLPTAVIALALGVGVATLAGVWMTVSQP